MGNGKAYKRADIQECGFVSAPVVTAIMKGHYCPSTQVWAVSDTRLYFMTVEDETASKMVRLLKRHKILYSVEYS